MVQCSMTPARDYETVCANCHGPGAVAAGMAPDLRASPMVLSAEAFPSIVREGARQFRSTPKYGTLTEARGSSCSPMWRLLTFYFPSVYASDGRIWMAVRRKS
jgi:hypothetical protein